CDHASTSTPCHLDTSTPSSSSPPAPLRGAESMETSNGATATRVPPPVHHQPDGLKDSSSLHAAASAALPDA
ncbi:MAG: hypothetical protein KGS45_14060, partial [Planctomycetes bacterium]|nr:hypothetical protein [Planctomycetota bacterium]